MNDELSTTIHLDNYTRVIVDEWDDGGVWLKIGLRNASAYTPLTREQAEELLAGLTKILEAA